MMRAQRDEPEFVMPSWWQIVLGGLGVAAVAFEVLFLGFVFLGD